MALPQREGRPALDLEPDNTPSNAAWAEHYDNEPANSLNKAVPKGSVKAPYHNGWERAGFEEYPFNPAAEKDKL